MFDPKLYREACRELRAPEDKIEEIIAMTEKTNKKRIRPLRTALIAAAAVAMMVVSVAAANPEGFQEFVYNIASVIQADQYRKDWTTPYGEQVAVFSLPDVSVDNRGGRAILVIDDRDAADITDALAREGRYEYDEVTEKTQLHIEVEGTAEKWTASISMDVPGGRTPYTLYQDSEGNGEMEVPAYSVPDDGENLWDDAVEYDGETMEEN